MRRGLTRRGHATFEARFSAEAFTAALGQAYAAVAVTAGRLVA